MFVKKKDPVFGKNLLKLAHKQKRWWGHLLNDDEAYESDASNSSSGSSSLNLFANLNPLLDFVPLRRRGGGIRQPDNEFPFQLPELPRDNDLEDDNRPEPVDPYQNIDDNNDLFQISGENEFAIKPRQPFGNPNNNNLQPINNYSGYSDNNNNISDDSDSDISNLSFNKPTPRKPPNKKKILKKKSRIFKRKRKNSI